MAEPVYVWGQSEPADWLPDEATLTAQQDTARSVQLGGEMFRWPDELEHPNG
jgi:hypothetical protein